MVVHTTPQYLERIPGLDVDIDDNPEVIKFQQQKAHDIVAMQRERGGDMTVTCSCGLRATVPANLAVLYPLEFTWAMCFFRERNWLRDRPVEGWFYSQAGHRDRRFGDDARVFIALFSSGDDTPDRRIRCVAGNCFANFYHGGGTHLYNPANHRTQVERHLAGCEWIAYEDAIRAWSDAAWTRIVGTGATTKQFIAPPRLKTPGDPCGVPSDVEFATIGHEANE